MNKKYLFSFTLILILLSYIFSVDRIISNKLSTLTANIKERYISNVLSISNFISQHFNQTNQIIQLKQSIIKNEKYKILYFSSVKTNDDLNTSLKSIKVISYRDFNNFSEVLLEASFNINKISALITPNGYSAGIAIQKDNQNIGYLNHHPKSNYAVYIGENKAPGITHGNRNKEYITIKYIPLWQHIKIGDEVITSGMDDIFSKGIKVGTIIEIKKLSTTVEALVKPYANVYNKNYLYIDINTSK